ncbi:sugar transferase [Rhodopseudomonas palustris]|uniref:sugar transferase n=1 Tax=Rhodopseudomonas palustris TaxID=1076 RepID=UPI0021F322AD|nr:sugar transferase [Rhodopseudomonas palustris]UYO44336.1 sugar transferase [Rhodopseudomonas palustris]
MMQILKRLLDIFGATIGLLLSTPILLGVALWIWLDSGRPVFFKQERLGRNGRTFTMLKFRSMVVNAEAMEEGLFSYADDRRITVPGKYIRATSLDELPQLFNILKGDMSIVGPRPPVVYELGSYPDFDERLKGRFIVKPGLTGLAQVLGRNALNWEQKIALDLQYIERFKNYGILEDIRIIFLTIGIVISMRNTIERRPESHINEN